MIPARSYIYIYIYIYIFFFLYFFYFLAARGGGGGEGRCRTFFFFFFPRSADHERDWPPCKVVFFGLATNALNVRNNNSAYNYDAYNVYFVSKPTENRAQPKMLHQPPRDIISSGYYFDIKRWKLPLYVESGISG